METIREQLMSLAINCSCTPYQVRMTATEYRDETFATWESVIYECSWCGRRKQASHRAESLFNWEQTVIRDC
jgi:hypothetical protein